MLLTWIIKISFYCWSWKIEATTFNVAIKVSSLLFHFFFGKLHNLSFALNGEMRNHSILSSCKIFTIFFLSPYNWTTLREFLLWVMINEFRWGLSNSQLNCSSIVDVKTENYPKSKQGTTFFSSWYHHPCLQHKLLRTEMKVKRVFVCNLQCYLFYVILRWENGNKHFRY